MDEKQPITAEEAREALDLIEATTRQMRRAVAHGGAPYFFIIWGVVWILGFGSAQVWKSNAHLIGTIWLTLDALGTVASFWVGWRIARRLHGPLYTPAIGLFWLAWIVYGVLIIYFAHPQSGNQLSLLLALYAMFGYVISGIFFRSSFLSGLGVTLTLVIIGGYLLVPAYFNLWMAVFGGGSLTFVGAYMLYVWR